MSGKIHRLESRSALVSGLMLNRGVASDEGKGLGMLNFIGGSPLLSMVQR